MKQANRQSIKQAYRHLRAANKRSNRNPGDYDALNAAAVADARFRSLALDHLRRLKPWANYPEQFPTTRALHCVRLYYCGSPRRRGMVPAKAGARW